MVMVPGIMLFFYKKTLAFDKEIEKFSSSALTADHSLVSFL